MKRAAPIIPFRPRRRWTRARDYHAPARRPRAWLFPLTLVLLPMGAFTAVFLWGPPPVGMAFPLQVPQVGRADRDSASFGPCNGATGGTCVVDGDTFWFHGEKIRIADINTPEVSTPQCAFEAELGAQATDRLTELLNDGPFSLEPADRDRDRYGRLLRVVTRGGESLGATLVAEGMAEEWQGYRRDWCG
jgi:micrococcal nuclease